jgi:hypothetical protein
VLAAGFKETKSLKLDLALKLLNNDSPENSDRMLNNNERNTIVVNKNPNQDKENKQSEVKRSDNRIRRPLQEKARLAILSLDEKVIPGNQSIKVGNQSLQGIIKLGGQSQPLDDKLIKVGTRSQSSDDIVKIRNESSNDKVKLGNQSVPENTRFESCKDDQFESPVSDLKINAETNMERVSALSDLNIEYGQATSLDQNISFAVNFVKKEQLSVQKIPEGTGKTTSEFKQTELNNPKIPESTIITSSGGSSASFIKVVPKTRKRMQFRGLHRTGLGPPARFRRESDQISSEITNSTSSHHLTPPPSISQRIISLNPISPALTNSPSRDPTSENSSCDQSPLQSVSTGNQCAIGVSRSKPDIFKSDNYLEEPSLMDLTFCEEVTSGLDDITIKGTGKSQKDSKLISNDFDEVTIKPAEIYKKKEEVAINPVIETKIMKQTRFNPNVNICNFENDIDEVRNAVNELKVSDKTNFIVNGNTYRRLEVIGKGGSCKVYKIMSDSNKTFALKKVKLNQQDLSVAEGYRNEIELLKKLNHHPRIIKLYEHEITPQGELLMVLEYGETDFDQMLKRNKDCSKSLNFIRNYFEQMLQAVDAIHAENIIVFFK